MIVKTIDFILGGKFCQRPITRNSIIITDAMELIKLMYKPGITVTDIMILADNAVLVTTEQPEEMTDESRGSNMSVANFVTAMGRCILYYHMQIAGKRMCYSDTGKFIRKESS